MSITNKEYISISYFVLRALFLGIGFSYMYDYTDVDTWISIILGAMLGIFFIMIFNKTSKNINHNLNFHLNKGSIINQIFKFIFFIFYIYIIVYMGIIFTNFVKVYYLFDTPLIVTLLLTFAVCYYTSLKTETVVIRTSQILIYLSLFMILLNRVMLTPNIDITNILPLYTTSPTNILISALIFAIASSTPHILLLEYDVSLKTKVKSYMLIVVVLFIINFFTTSILGEYLLKAYSYPEYMVLRRIRLSEFIENIENFAAVIWYFDAFIIISLSMAKLRKLVLNRKKDVALPILFSILSCILGYLFTSHYVYINLFFSSGIIVLGIFLLILGPVFCLTTRKKKLSTS